MVKLDLKEIRTEARHSSETLKNFFSLIDEKKDEAATHEDEDTDDEGATGGKDKDEEE